MRKLNTRTIHPGLLLVVPATSLPAHTTHPGENEKVYWQSDDQPKELNFFSISSDGRVASWVMSKNELKMEPVMQLKLVNTIKVRRLRGQPSRRRSSEPFAILAQLAGSVHLRARREICTAFVAHPARSLEENRVLRDGEIEGHLFAMNFPYEAAT